MAKSDILDQLKAKRKELQGLKDEIQRLKKGKQASDISEADDVIAEVEELIEEANGIQWRNGKIADFVNFLKKLFKVGMEDGMAGIGAQVTVSVIGAFVNKYLNKNIQKELVNFSVGPTTHRWGRFSLTASVGLSLKVAVNGEGTSDIVVVRGAMGGFAPFSAKASLDAGFTIPVLDEKVDCMLEGGIEGELSATVGAAVSLVPDGPNLKGSLAKTALNTELDLLLYFIIPESVVKAWNAVVPYSFNKMKKIDNPRLEYKKDNMQLLVVNIPGYDVTFSMKTGEFTGKASGSFSVATGADVKVMVDNVQKYLPW